MDIVLPFGRLVWICAIDTRQTQTKQGAIISRSSVTWRNPHHPIQIRHSHATAVDSTHADI
ncbi:hypothetical protein LSUCC0246_05715 [Rhodobacterales bacterium LSUCC0246]|nr:hypothetical protein [Rhodobacterales bacterium LSUCC0374]